MGKPSEIDLLVETTVPIALEYQGEYHYFDMLAFGEREVFDQSDPMKAAQCGFQMKSLVEVPYWWDRSVEQLKKSLQSLRPE